jgi:hypothetical protein
VYVASADVTAVQLWNDSQMERLFRGVATVLGNAGICLGRVVFHDLPEWARLKYSIVNIDSTGPCDPLSQLFTLGLAQSPSVHLFLVDGLDVTDNGDQFQIAGIDGSIPGPSGVPGTVNVRRGTRGGPLARAVPPDGAVRDALRPARRHADLRLRRVRSDGRAGELR